MLKKILFSGLALLLCAGLASAAMLNGAGATFPYPIYMKWNKTFADSSGIRVNYQGIGSGGGVRQFTVGVTDFGGSDAAMSDEEMSKAGGDVLHIPTVMGAVAVCYNLPGVTGLKLDAETLAAIFLGRIKKWNDPAIAGLNSNITLPDRSIIVAHRSDGSGTTDIFTGYLAKVNLAWASQVGKGKAVSWPVGLGGKGNAGVAGLVKVNEGAIGYVELSYAITNNLPVVSLKNKAGYFVEPSLDSTSAAASGALQSKKMKQLVNTGDFRLDLNNAPGKDSYPIVGMTWLLVHKNQKNAEKGQALKQYLKWILTDGQKYAAKLLYAPLPDDIAAMVLQLVNSIKT
jgi:phosphate transport system substrate-binding protein